MLLDLTHPPSIVAWFRAAPQRHGPQLRHFATLWPQFAPAIAQARELLRQPINQETPAP